jgi:hypothetical protein
MIKGQWLGSAEVPSAIAVVIMIIVKSYVSSVGLVRDSDNSFLMKSADAKDRRLAYSQRCSPIEMCFQPTLWRVEHMNQFRQCLVHLGMIGGVTAY